MFLKNAAEARQEIGRQLADSEGENVADQVRMVPGFVFIFDGERGHIDPTGEITWL
jgi:hypothetical protein